MLCTNVSVLDFSESPSPDMMTPPQYQTAAVSCTTIAPVAEVTEHYRTKKSVVGALQCAIQCSLYITTLIDIDCFWQSFSMS
jgi:hypothetical protein